MRASSPRPLRIECRSGRASWLKSLNEDFDAARGERGGEGNRAGLPVRVRVRGDAHAFDEGGNLVGEGGQASGSARSPGTKAGRLVNAQGVLNALGDGEA